MPIFLFLALGCANEVEEIPQELEGPAAVQTMEEGGGLITLDLSEAERLLQIFHINDDNNFKHAAFLLDSTFGELVYYKYKRSPYMKSMLHFQWSKTVEERFLIHAQNEIFQNIHVFDGNEFHSSSDFLTLLKWEELEGNNFLMHVQNQDDQQLIAYIGGEFIESTPFKSIKESVILSSNNKIMSVKSEDSNDIIEFNGQSFEYHQSGDKITKLKLSPDSKSYTYTISKERKSYYGLGNDLYTSALKWLRLGEENDVEGTPEELAEMAMNAQYAYLGKDAEGAQVFINYKPLGKYESISQFMLSKSKEGVVFIGNSEDEYFVH